ncbi:hypothetical protein MKS88_004557 [Plasmodium brasilianum]|uniref:Uncharacterized protein n=2 Tax=Plasmodium (Plasmodium) TaxID=418103 RepID=A0A1A8W7A4_PLAMA|nr:conserved Plasmodium protein, unknown function [Plasmodium malariae]KAI4836753.1 hypothetical protein MKS88_004557 [Plasmodium brasilianum]SBS88683.1 conserved Plasmodium protein, unknown function [Plasmodium malariae]SCO94043.1 conserved Plasmodium protein, unknown function [Plasmodium malariae]
MKRTKTKLASTLLENEEKTCDHKTFLKLYDTDSDINIDEKYNSLFKFFKNIKINNEEKKKSLSKICCTKNYLFISTSDIFSQVRIFNYNNLINSRKSEKEYDERITSMYESEEHKEDLEKKGKANTKEQGDQNGENYDDETLISLCDIYTKGNYFKEINDSDNDMLSINNVNKLFNNVFCEEKKNFLLNSNYKSKIKKAEEDNYKMNYINVKEIIIDDVNGDYDNPTNRFIKRDKNNQQNILSTYRNVNKETINFSSFHELDTDYDAYFKEEYLYYDNFIGISKKKKNEKDPLKITRDMLEEEKNKREKEEEMKKKKILEEENLRYEELQKNGYYMNSDLLEINVDVVKRKTTQVNNLIEYIGVFTNISSPIILMKMNNSENILSLLTYSGSVYSYDISETSLKELKEKRVKKIEFFSNIENYFHEMEKNNTLNEFLDDHDEEATVQPISICNSYFTYSVKCFDFLSDDKTLICVGLNKDYFLSFISTYTGKKIIYNKKIKIKKPSKSNMNNVNNMDKANVQLSLIYNFNYIHVDKERKMFNGEMGNFIYLGSSCGYIVFIFISEKLVEFVNNIMNNDQIRDGSVFIYDPDIDYSLAKNFSEYIIGNVEDMYKINKDNLYASCDITRRSSMCNTSLFGSSSGNIFKNVEDKFFSYAYYITKNVKINSITSLKANKNQIIHLIVALNDGRLLNLLFEIYPGYCSTTSVTNSSCYSVLNQNHAEKYPDHNKHKNNNNVVYPSGDNYGHKFIKKSDKIIYDFTGLHKSTSITKTNFCEDKFQNSFIFINSNVKKVCEMSDRNFYTTYVLDICDKKIHILYQHLAYIIDSCISSYFYFCLDDNNTIAVFSSSYDEENCFTNYPFE